MSISVKVLYKAANYPRIAKHLSPIKIAWANIFYSENPDKIRESAVFIADQIFVASPESRAIKFCNKKMASFRRFLGSSLKTYWMQRYSAEEMIQVALNSKKSGQLSLEVLNLCKSALSRDPHVTWKTFIAETIIPYVKFELRNRFCRNELELRKDPLIVMLCELVK